MDVILYMSIYACEAATAVFLQVGCFWLQYALRPKGRHCQLPMGPPLDWSEGVRCVGVWALALVANEVKQFKNVLITGKSCSSVKYSRQRRSDRATSVPTHPWGLLGMRGGNAVV